MPSCYVYYRVAPACAAAARAALDALLAEIAAATGVTGRALRNPAEPLLWMEVYEAVPDAGPWANFLAEAAARHGLAACATDGRRHVEFFEPLPASRAALPPNLDPDVCASP